jgi:hypothetical protein
MKPSPPAETPFQRFDRAFRAIISVPKAVVEKEEAKERIRNARKRARRKRAVA